MVNHLYNESELQNFSKLILCIEEHDDTNTRISVDSRLFISWDCATSKFYVRGRRQDTTVGSNHVPYTFSFNNINELYVFIEFVMGNNEHGHLNTNSTTNMILYNYNNMSLMDNETLTYEFFQNNLDPDYEITGYNNIQITKSIIKKLLKLLKNTNTTEYNFSYLF